MKLRLIVFVLSLLAVLSATTGGHLYYRALKQSALAETERTAASRATALKDRVSSFLHEQQKPVRALAGLQEIQEALSTPNADTLAEANSILDHFNSALGTNVCYLMNHEGNTIASSNRTDPDSFVGRNFGFRPYFKGAMAGNSSIYMALGTVSIKRGVYYGHPVYGQPRDIPTGVVVIKTSVDPLEKELRQEHEEIVLLTDPHGIVFVSARNDWLFHRLRKLPPAEAKAIAETLQFGSGPFRWVGLQSEGPDRMVDESGQEYLSYTREIDGFRGWRVVYLKNLSMLYKRLTDPLQRTTGSIIASLCLLIGIAVVFLYRNASSDIIRRKEAEEALILSEARYRHLYHNTPAMLHSIDPAGRLISVSDYWLESLGYERDAVIGRKLTDFLSADSRRLAEEFVIPEFLAKGYCKDISYQFVKRNGDRIDVLLSAIAELDDSGEVKRSLAVLVDVTERKHAEEELNLAKEELGRYSEELERQVAERTREVKGILRNTPSVVFLKSADFRYLLVNDQFERLFGIAEEQMRGKTDYEVFSTEIADRFRSYDQKVLSERGPVQVEEQVPHPDGIRTYLTVRFPLYDDIGTVRSICGIATDITAISKAQDQLRRLSAGIMAGQENERAAIARELHDELGQMLTALRIDAVWLRDRLNRMDPGTAQRAVEMCNLIDQTIDDVRTIALRLRPGVLDDLGLIPALEWYVSEFEKRTGIQCVFEHANVPQVNTFVSTAAYRIAQEALTNLARHSSSTRARVSIETEQGTLILAVIDEGDGFDTSGLADSEGLGIAGMQERAVLVGGALEIESEPGAGTRVFFRAFIGTVSGATQ
jgi:PAS domain S-box-containing protein